MSDDATSTRHRWEVQHGERSGPEEYVAEMAWVSDAGTLQIDNHVDGKWLVDAIFNAPEWRSVIRVEEG